MISPIPFAIGGTLAGLIGFWLGWRQAFKTVARNRWENQQFLDRYYQRYRTRRGA